MSKKIWMAYNSQGEVRYFDTKGEARRFALKVANANKRVSIVKGFASK